MQEDGGVRLSENCQIIVIFSIYLSIVSIHYIHKLFNNLSGVVAGYILEILLSQRGEVL